MLLKLYSLHEIIAPQQWNNTDHVIITIYATYWHDVNSILVSLQYQVLCISYVMQQLSVPSL